MAQLKGLTKKIPLSSKSSKGNDPMEWTTAGLLPISKIENNDCYLLAQERRSDEWADLGGLREHDESPIATAAREALIQSRGVIGDLDEVSHNTIETVTYGPHCTFMCQWPDLTAPLFPSAFKKAQAKGPRYNEIKNLAWVKVADVYKAIAEASDANPYKVDVNGKWLRERVITAIRQTCGYARFLQEQHELGHAMANPVRVREITMGFRDKNTTKGVIPLVVLTDGQGQPRKVFGVLKESSDPEKLEIEDRTYLNPEYIPGILERISLASRWLLKLRRPQPTLQERWAICHALEEQGFWHYFRRGMLDWRCRNGEVSISLFQRLLDPFNIQ